MAMDRDALVALVASRLRDVQDFPEPGVLFKDFTPLLADPHAMRAVVDDVVARYEGRIDVIAGIEARGFMIGTACAVDGIDGEVRIGEQRIDRHSEDAHQLLLRIFTASRGRLLTGRIEASVLTSMALPSGRASWRAYMARPMVLTVSIRLAGAP